MRRFRERESGGFSTTRIIVFGFFMAIVLGTALLMLPFATAEGEHTTPVDALFTATTSVCVTGLVTVPTFSHWTLFGQIIIALLAQVGGLGVITFTTIFLIVLRKKIGLKERLLIQAAYNLDTIQGLVILIKKIIKGTLVVEGVGALLYMTVFVPDYGAIGIWKSIFNAVSAFCNAGMDVLGESSLQQYAANPVVNFTTMFLIILGGIGFPVWWNVIEVIRYDRSEYTCLRDSVHHLKLHSKVVLAVTGCLIAGGAFIILLLEYNNEATLGAMPFWQKLQAALFQSVTTRTAGFFTISQSGLRTPTAFICCLLMFIGGSPSGTAGGIKTTTFAILIMTVISIIRGRNDTEMFERKVNGDVVRRALSIFMVSLIVMLVSVITLAAVQPAPFIDCFFEAVSAIATVGLSRDLTPFLTTAGKIVIIITMYIGRIGPISLALFFNSKRFINLKTYKEENVSVG